MSPWMRMAAALAAIACAVFALRAVGLERVFPPGGPVVLMIGDGAYHARLASYAFANFPGFLTFDPYLAGPLGGAVPWPPLFDLAVAGTARLVSDRVESVETALAWAGPVLGAASVMLVWAAARCVAGWRVALGAAALYAAFGITNGYGAVGNGDHHAFVTTLGAAWLALAMGFVAHEKGGARLAWLAAGLAVVRAAMLLGWAGSLFYVGLADTVVVVACAVLGDRTRMTFFGVGSAASAALVVPVVLRLGTPSGGPFSTIMLSWLHVLVSAGLAVAALAWALSQARWPARSAAGRVARLAAAGLAAAAVVLAVPSVRTPLLIGLRFMTMSDSVGAVTYEQLPLFALFGRAPVVAAQYYFGWLAYVLPVAPIAALLAACDARRRAPACVLAAWSAPLAVLSILQTRYGNDFGPAAAVCFALAFERLARLLATRLGDAPSGVLVVALAGASMAPAVTPLLAGAPATLAFLRGDAPRGDALVVTPTGTLVRFAQMIREATPETPGFLDAGGRPTWGILSNAIFGHTLRYYARRPVAADNFWDKFPSFERAAAFGDLGDEGEALTAAHELGARYLMTAAGGTRDVETINGRLQTEDGVARDGRPRLEHFRLVTEGPKGGSPLSDVVGARRPAHVLAYKLFEIVPGALLEVAAVPDTPVEAALRVLSPYGRSFVYRAEAVSGPDGVARLRVPYATRTALPTHPTGPWRVRAGAAEWSVDLDDGQIESGATIRVSR